MKSLDLNRFPLTGTSLIEASAGTGKTFTIAGLYSRLLLGHNSGYERLRADQILVVTFTNAATEELRGRIRERIRSNLDDVL
ncbi:MAG: UvrD-helicase domain-containing protein, partial [Oceanobacter sp.]